MPLPNILWMGGEDVDFPNGPGPPFVWVTPGAGLFNYRPDYSRCAVNSLLRNGTYVRSTVFPGGAVTSAWMSAQVYTNTSGYYIGLGKSGTGNAVLLAAGANLAAGQQIEIWKTDGTTFTKLITSTDYALRQGGLTKIDINLQNYGASSTVTVYANGSSAPDVVFSGNCAAGGATNVDSVFLYGNGDAGGGQNMCSEIIVSDQDTRLMSLVTLAPNADGDLNQWGGTYANINDVSINDATVVSDSTAGDVFLANLTDLPVGSTFTVLGVKMAARASRGFTGITSLELGCKTNSTVNVSSPVALSTAWTQEENYYQQNPVTAVPWLSSEINALQLALKSAA